MAWSAAFLVPVALIQTVLELPRLRAIGAPWVSAVLTFPVVQSVTQCILPQFFLNVILAPAAFVIAYLTKLAGPVSLSAVDFSVIQKHFAFLTIAVFFGSFVTSSFLNQLTMWRRHPSQALSILGTSIPLTSLFFLNFVEFCALVAAPFALLRAPALTLFACRSAAAYTERAKARLWQDQFANYGRTLPRHGLIALIGLVFAPITPLCPPMCLLYFLVASITEKYNLLYVQRPRYQSGGRLWPLASDALLVSLVVGQSVLVFLLFVRSAPGPALVVVPLIPATLLFRVAARRLVEEPFAVLSLRAAVDLDAADAAEGVGEILRLLPQPFIEGGVTVADVAVGTLIVLAVVVAVGGVHEVVGLD